MLARMFNMLYTRTGCQILPNGIMLMEGSLEWMQRYKLHIKAMPSTTHANMIQSMGTSSIVDGT